MTFCKRTEVAKRVEETKSLIYEGIYRGRYKPFTNGMKITIFVAQLEQDKFHVGWNYQAEQTAVGEAVSYNQTTCPTVAANRTCLYCYAYWCASHANVPDYKPGDVVRLSNIYPAYLLVIEERGLEFLGSNLLDGNARVFAKSHHHVRSSLAEVADRFNQLNERENV